MASIILAWLRKKSRKNFFYPEVEKAVVSEDVKADEESFSEKLITPFKSMFERPVRRHRVQENQLHTVQVAKKDEVPEQVEMDHTKIPLASEAAAKILKDLKERKVVEESRIEAEPIPKSPETKRKREFVDLQVHELPMQTDEPIKFLRLKDEFTRTYKCFPVVNDSDIYTFANQKTKDDFTKPKIDTDDNDDDVGTTAEQAKVSIFML